MDVIICHRCGGVMRKSTTKHKAFTGIVIVEVEWKCTRCGAVRGAIQGG